MKISSLRSGGIITNYFCSSRCGHCLYNCSPSWPKDYITPEHAGQLARKIRSLGCRTVHIGGGEPLLAPDKLIAAVDAVRSNGVGIEYVETNSSWYKDADSADALLERLQRHGIGTLLVSVSPFHLEYIPFKKVKGVLEACGRTGMGTFVWIPAFHDELDSLDDAVPHAIAELAEEYGSGYLKQIPDRYWITMGGRALETFRDTFKRYPAEKILAEADGACPGLTDTSHFHCTVYGGYVPGLCPGLSIDAGDLGAELDGTKYPFLTLLHDQGIRGLYDRAVRKYGYCPERTFLNKCDLCTDIRTHLVRKRGVRSADLRPREHYLPEVTGNSVDQREFCLPGGGDGKYNFDTNSC